MTLSEVLQAIQIAILLLGFSGLVIWLRQWIFALRGALQAQNATIDTQKIVIESMSNFLTVADAPKMLERYEAYKKLVDHEKEAILRKQEGKEFSEQGLLGMIIDMLPYVPSAQRGELLASAKISALDKEQLNRVAKVAPDLLAEKIEQDRNTLRKTLLEHAEQMRREMDVLKAEMERKARVLN